MKVSPAGPGEAGAARTVRYLHVEGHNPETSSGISKKTGGGVYYVSGERQVLYSRGVVGQLQSSTQVFSLHEPRDKPPHAFPSYAFLSTPLSPGGPWRAPPTVPTTPSPVPPSPPLPPRFHATEQRCVQLPLAGINTRHPQL